MASMTQGVKFVSFLGSALETDAPAVGVDQDVE